MRTTALNQIFGMLAITATSCGTETALAQSATPPPENNRHTLCYGHT
jgi:hypothetical protein